MPIKGSYLAFDGYHLPKKNLKKEQIEEIKKNLTVTPIDSGYAGGDENTSKYKIYNDTESYIIVPRYYGIEKFGDPEKIKFDIDLNTNNTTNNTTNIQFTGVLRDYQKEIVEKCLTHIKKYGGGMLVVHCGAGKCLAKGTEIIMYNGKKKLVENIQVGDQIMGDDSQPRNILHLAWGREEMFNVCSGGKKVYTVNKSHILSLINLSEKIEINSKIYNKNEIVDISVDDYLDLAKECNLKKINVPLKGYKVCLNFKEQNIDCDYNLFGRFIAEKILCLKISNTYIDNALDLEIPDVYKYNSKQKQLNLLVGIIESYHLLKYGISKSFERLMIENRSFKIEYKHSDDLNGNYKSIKKIVNDIEFISNCLGFKTSLNNDCLTIFFDKINQADQINQTNRTNQTNATSEISEIYDITLESIGIDEYYGFEIDKNKRFVLGDFSVTHNTSMAIYIASVLGLKTLVLTHKSFLQDQWVDRIKQFTKSRVGIIRQKTVDVEDKDFVIGMIQSISKRNYDPNIFKGFGLVCIDECHRFGSKHFSNALYKVGAKYTIALTATPKRADGLMKVVNWFTGDIMFQKKLQINNQVITKIIGFLSTDKLFKEVTVLRKVQKFGKWVTASKPDFVQMISNLIEIKERNELIITILNTLRANPDRKILVLSERIAHLKLLKEGLDKKIQESVDSGEILKDECKTYFYIGELKKNQREKAEIEADVLFGSYKMAEEGLDIERLNTLVLASPKKDVVQSCGRILRKINKDTIPMIIDISDKLSVFASQAKKREEYYTKCKYIQHFYYTQNGNLISPSKYLDLTNNPSQNANIEIPKSFKDILEVPEPEVIEIIDDVIDDADDKMYQEESDETSDYDTDDEKPKKKSKKNTNKNTNNKKINDKIHKEEEFDEKPKKPSKKNKKSLDDNNENQPESKFNYWF